MEPENKATILYMIDNPIKAVWMGRKTRKVGTGYYFGYGGKIEDGQSPMICIIEETKDETGGVLIFEDTTELVGMMDFYKGDAKPENPTFRVWCYRTFTFKGTPLETEEMADPKPFPISEITLEKMRDNPDFKPGDELFVPLIVEGKTFIGEIWFSSDSSQVFDSNIRLCELADLPKE